MIDFGRAESLEWRGQPHAPLLDEYTLITVEDPEATFKPLVYEVAAYVHALQMHLRDQWSPDGFNIYCPKTLWTH